jgi:hypothetical protein
MGKADFGTVDSTIAGGFDNGQERRKIWIEYYAVDEILAKSQRLLRWHADRTYLDRVHLDSSAQENRFTRRGQEEQERERSVCQQTVQQAFAIRRLTEPKATNLFQRPQLRQIVNGRNRILQSK